MGAGAGRTLPVGELEVRASDLVSFERHDVLRDAPSDKRFDLVLCRNLAFTYFDEAGQRVVAEHLARATAPGGALVLGRHETLPENVGEFEPWSDAARIYRRCTSAASGT